MKKTILLLALLAGAASAAQAQRTEAKPANTIGLTAAYARTNLAGGNSLPYSSTSHSAYQAGLTADVYVSPVVSFHPEVLYTMRYFDATDEALNRDLTYLDVPLLVRYHAAGLFFEAGPQVSLPLTAKNEEGNDVKPEVNKAGLDYVVGLGYQLHHGPSLGIRYDGGITSVFKKEVSTLGTDKLKSHTFLLVLGYAFGGK
ncbi:porin family protein [Hymenobacter chitinivorans]|uniref:Outer membrane protein with beta-barrel domain n=1 Tax=Hymenobacter chitinivorans DSM 11115 TaxID=1121954 RepID=A0A2M9ASW1_9BACT|nr:porin family protein [Hymenobacter chitinivorans]PJJ48801.1 outer membrane protein with beta-barrel domain [Hymenobacter chitinivorans DSM 11115]